MSVLMGFLHGCVRTIYGAGRILEWLVAAVGAPQDAEFSPDTTVPC